MREFQCPALSQLAHELTLAPVRHRVRAVEAARTTISTLDAGRSYPLSFLVYQITGYRSRKGGPDGTRIAGRVAIGDLVLLVEKVTLGNPLTPNGEALLDAAEVCSRWRISAKTLDRWRERGLAACWFAPPDGPNRLLFQRDDCEGFERRHAERIRRAGDYRRVDHAERRALAEAALKIIEATECGIGAACERVARKMKRNGETVRKALHWLVRGGDSLNATEGTDDDGRDAPDSRYRHGRCGADGDADGPKGPADRLAELVASPIQYMYAPEFDHPRAEGLILAPRESRVAFEDAAARTPPDLPAYLAELYRTPLLLPEDSADLFRRFNYLLYRAEEARRLLDPRLPCTAAVEHIEGLLARAAAIKNRIVQSNLRLVVSIARRHLGRVPRMDLFELVAEGNLILMRAARTFDFTRGLRFTTYASWAVMRHFARLAAETSRYGRRYLAAVSEVAESAADVQTPDPEEQAGETERDDALAEVVKQLQPREREIVLRRFGLRDYEPQTLEEVAGAIQVSRETVRQIERRTLLKLRHALARRGVTEAAF